MSLIDGSFPVTELSAECTRGESSGEYDGDGAVHGSRRRRRRRRLQSPQQAEAPADCPAGAQPRAQGRLAQPPPATNVNAPGILGGGRPARFMHPECGTRGRREQSGLGPPSGLGFSRSELHTYNVRQLS